MDVFFNYQFRLIIVGDSHVGKSRFLSQFVDRKFSDRPTRATVGVDYYSAIVNPPSNTDIRIRLHLWDTAGQERYRSITQSYYRHSVGVILMYDITDKESFENLDYWYEQARLNILPREAVYLCVGHKVDLDFRRTVTYQEGHDFANRNDMIFFEASAKTGKNVSKAIMTLTDSIYDRFACGALKMHPDWEGIRTFALSGHSLQTRRSSCYSSFIRRRSSQQTVVLQQPCKPTAAFRDTNIKLQSTVSDT